MSSGPAALTSPLMWLRWAGGSCWAWGGGAEPYKDLFTIGMLLLILLLWIILNKFAAGNFDTIDLALLYNQILSMTTQMAFRWSGDALSVVLFTCIQVIDFDVDFFNITCSINFNLSKYSPLVQLMLPVIIFLILFARAVFVQCIVLLESDTTEARLSDEERQAREKNPLSSLMLLLFDEEDGTKEKSRQKAKRHLAFKEKNKETSVEKAEGESASESPGTPVASVSKKSDTFAKCMLAIAKYFECPTTEAESLIYVEEQLNTFTNFLNIVYHTLCIKSFTVFVCTELADGSSVLSMAPDIKCWEGEHLLFLLAGVFGVQLYVLGIPLMLWMVVRNGERRAMLNDENYLRRYGWMYTRYTQSCRCWETVFLVRRATFAFILVNVSNFPMMQVIMGRPFLDTRNFAIETGALFSNICVLLFGCTFYISAVHADEAYGYNFYFEPITFMFIVGTQSAFAWIVFKDCRDVSGAASAKKRLRQELEQEQDNLPLPLTELNLDATLKGTKINQWVKEMLDDGEMDEGEKMTVMAYYYTDFFIKDFVSDTSEYSYFSGTLKAVFYRRLAMSMPFLLDWLSQCTPEEHAAFRIVSASLQETIPRCTHTPLQEAIPRRTHTPLQEAISRCTHTPLQEAIPRRTHTPLQEAIPRCACAFLAPRQSTSTGGELHCGFSWSAPTWELAALTCHVGRELAAPTCHVGRELAALTCHVGRELAVPTCHVGRELAAPTCHVGRELAALTCHVGRELAAPTCHVGRELAAPTCHVRRELAAPTCHVGRELAAPTCHVGRNLAAPTCHVGRELAAPTCHVGRDLAALTCHVG
ncbi:hypothetical protein CYMTET_27609, partial [Cymbomonas tetramitiformis]